jgi:transposase
VRAREDATAAELKARQQLKAFLLRTSWPPAHLRWLSELKLPLPAQHIVFQEDVDAITTTTSRIARLCEQLRQGGLAWRTASVVEALQALRGVQLMVAATVVGELGDLTRFDHPRQLMAFVGLVPSESASGPTTQRGSITKTANAHARRALVAAAWQYSLPARLTRLIRLRQEHRPQPICANAWQALVRLWGRFRSLRAKGTCEQKVVTAMARGPTCTCSRPGLGSPRGSGVLGIAVAPLASRGNLGDAA